MKCAMCSGETFLTTGTIEFDSKTLGMVCVPDITHKKCNICGDILIPSSESNKIIDFVRKKEKQAIGLIPFCNFVSLNEAANILGISKQAFSKNPKINNGLIYSAILGKRRYYVRKSVELFKENGNGKYLLSRVKTFDDLKNPFFKTFFEQWVEIPSSKIKPSRQILKRYTSTKERYS